MTLEKNVTLSRTLIKVTTAFSLVAAVLLFFSPLGVRFVASLLTALSSGALLVSDSNLLAQHEIELNRKPWIVCCCFWCGTAIYFGVRLAS